MIGRFEKSTLQIKGAFRAEEGIKCDPQSPDAREQSHRELRSLGTNRLNERRTLFGTPEVPGIHFVSADAIPNPITAGGGASPDQSSRNSSMAQGRSDHDPPIRANHSFRESSQTAASIRHGQRMLREPVCITNITPAMPAMRSVSVQSFGFIADRIARTISGGISSHGSVIAARPMRTDSS